MYLFNELLMSVPLVVYAGWRLRRLIARRALKNFSTALLALLTAGYPAAESLSHGTIGGALKLLVLAGYYALPLVLYFTMTVFLTDLAVAILRMSKAVSRQTVRSDKFRLRRLAFVLSVPVLVVAAGIVNANVLRVHEYSVEVPRRSSTLRELKVVFASDLHLGTMTSKGWLARFVDKVNAQKPDIVLIGGDIREGHRGEADIGAIEAQFQRLEARYGVFAVPGNHEGYAGITGEFFDRSHIRFLQDELAIVEGAFTLVGRRDSRRGTRESVDDLLRKAPDGLPVILLDHRPTDMEAVGRTRSTFSYRGTPTTASCSPSTS